MLESHLSLVADHDVVLHGVGDVVDGKHQASAVFDAGEAGSRPRHHVAGGVRPVDRPHIRLQRREGGTFRKTAS